MNNTRNLYISDGQKPLDINGLTTSNTYFYASREQAEAQARYFKTFPIHQNSTLVVKSLDENPLSEQVPLQVALTTTMCNCCC